MDQIVPFEEQPHAVAREAFVVDLPQRGGHPGPQEGVEAGRAVHPPIVASPAIQEEASQRSGPNTS